MKDFNQYAAVPGTKFEDLMPDFFLDDFSEANQKTIGRNINLGWGSKYRQK